MPTDPFATDTPQGRLLIDSGKLMAAWLDKYAAADDARWEAIRKQYHPPREAFVRIPRRVDEWADRAEAIALQITALEREYEEARVKAWEYVPNPDYDPEIAREWFTVNARKITLGDENADAQSR